MKKINILIPIYNDWDSTTKLIKNICLIISEINNFEFHFILINDASTIPMPEFKIAKKIKSLKVINMKKNQGHARCIAFGIKYLAKNNDFDYTIIMDGDGEDRPEEIEMLIKKIELDQGTSVVAKRIKRSEGIFFQLLYQLHKAVTVFFTGKIINFGNYSCLTKDDIINLSNKESLWSSFSGTLKKNIFKLNTINSIRGKRYFGPSKMSLFKLLIHSFSIIAVFKRTVFIRSIILIVLASYFSLKFPTIVIALQVIIVVFGLIIYLISLREDKKAFLNSDSNQDDTNLFTH